MRSLIVAFVRVAYPRGGDRLVMNLLTALHEMDTSVAASVWTATADNATNNETMIDTLCNDLTERDTGDRRIRYILCLAHVLQLVHGPAETTTRASAIVAARRAVAVFTAVQSRLLEYSRYVLCREAKITGDLDPRFKTFADDDTKQLIISTLIDKYQTYFDVNRRPRESDMMSPPSKYPKLVTLMNEMTRARRHRRVRVSILWISSRAVSASERIRFSTTTLYLLIIVHFMTLCAKCRLNVARIQFWCLECGTNRECRFSTFANVDRDHRQSTSRYLQSDWRGHVFMETYPLKYSIMFKRACF
jgi:hypothetical protein